MKKIEKEEECPIPMAIPIPDSEKRLKKLEKRLYNLEKGQRQILKLLISKTKTKTKDHACPWI